MRLPELILLLGYLSLVFELIWLAVPSVASTRRLLVDGRGVVVKVALDFVPAVVLSGLFVLPVVLLTVPSLCVAPWCWTPHTALRWLGVFGIVLGRGLTIWATLKMRWATANTLVTSGPFRFSRHPGLLGMFLFFGGAALALSSFLVVLGLLVYVLHMRRKLRIEEAYLLERHGELAQRYFERVPRYVGRAQNIEPNNADQRTIARWFDATYSNRGLAYLRPVRAYRVFLDFLDLSPGSRVLDVGSGPGQLLAAAIERDISAVGVDISTVAARLARERFGRTVVAPSNAEHLPFANHSFDAVTCIGVFERIVHRSEALAEIRRVLRPGGRACFMVRNSRTLSWLLWNRWLGQQNREGHQDALTLNAWRTLFTNAGFDIESVHGDRFPAYRRFVPLPIANEFIFLLTTGPTPDRLYESLARLEIIRYRLRGRADAPRLRKSLCGSPDGETLDVDAWTLARAPKRSPLRVLDMGSGFGTTLHDWALKRPDWDCVGVTPSRVQIRWAKKRAERLGIANRCQFLRQDVLGPLEGSFDLVTALESLQHSADLSRAIAQLVERSTPQGRIVIVDDVLAAGVDPIAPAVTELARRWNSPPMRSREAFRAALLAAGALILAEEDWTSRVRISATVALERRRRRLLFFRKWIPIPAARRLLDAFLGGVALEELYRSGKTNYVAFVAEPPGSSR